MKSITEVKDLKNKKVLLRVDWNAPIKNGRILDTSRIEASFETINYLMKKGAEVIIITHLGEKGETLLPIVRYVKKTYSVTFVKSISDTQKKQKNDLIVLENIRTWKGEEKNTISFAKELAGIAQLYVNDAFSVSHRAHASIVGIPKYLPGYAGLLLTREVEHLSKALKPPHPFLVIMGGAKFETKLPLIKRFAKTADMLAIDGALANELFEEEGLPVGKSVVDPKDFHMKKLAAHKNILLPIDVVVERGKKSYTISPKNVLPNDIIVDAGEKTVKAIGAYAKRSELILWNGPLGNYERGYEKGTDQLLKLLAKKGVGKHVIIGGGDTAGIVGKLKLQKKFLFVSLGGGATLEFLAEGSLPGIKALS